VASPWITAIGIPHMLRAVRAVGGDPDAIVARFGLDPDPAYDDRIGIATFVDVWEAALAATGRRDLPVQTALQMVNRERSWLGFIVANTPRLGDGVARMDRYYPTVSNAYRWQSSAGGDRDTLQIATTPPGPIHRLGWQMYIEYEAIDLAVSAVAITAGAARPVALRFVHPAPPTEVIAEMARVVGVAPQFGADATAVTFPASVLDLAVPAARPSLCGVMIEKLDAMLDAIERGTDVSTRARAEIAGLLRDGRCDVDELARALAMSRRSLERALAAEGTSAGAVIDDERRQLALTWLPQLTVDEVAARLGYSDSRAFARAFKRWTGVAPSEYRRGQPITGDPR
jgi:AraC-like DNA-binding protein